MKEVRCYSFFDKITEIWVDLGTKYIAIPMNQQSSRQYLMSLVIIFGALLFAQVLFIGLVYFLFTSENRTPDTATDSLFQIIVPIVAVMNVGLSYFIPKRIIQAVQSKENQSLMTKLGAFRTALLIRCAFLESVSLFGSISYVLTGNLMYLGIAGLMVILFTTFVPTSQRVEDELQLSYQEKAILEDPNGIVG